MWHPTCILPLPESTLQIVHLSSANSRGLCFHFLHLFFVVFAATFAFCSVAAALFVFFRSRFIFFASVSHTHWYVTFNVTITLSASAFSSRSFNLLQFQFNHPFPSPLRLLVLFVSLPHLTSHGHPFHSTSDSHNSTAHNRCDQFHSFFDFSFDVLIFVVLERSICACSDHSLSVDRYMSRQSIHFDLHEWYVVSCVDAAFEISKSFL